MRKRTLIGLAVLLGGCSGGGSGGGSPAPAPAPNVSSAGIWNGTATLNGVVINELSCLIAADNQLGCFLLDPANDRLAGAILGTVTTAGSSVTGSGTSYTTAGYTHANGSTVAQFTITSGAINERVGLNFSASLAGQNYSVAATFDPIYDVDSSFTAIAGAYQAFPIDGVATSLSINTNGVIFMQSASGCTGNGQASVIDSRSNGYRLSVTISNCPGLNGTYTGLATMDGAIILFGVFNATDGVIGITSK